MYRWAGLMVAIAAWGAAGVAATASAQDRPSFPASLERDPLLLWLQRETDIMPERVLAVTPQAITSIVSVFPAGGGQEPRVVIRAEALSAETHMRTGALSWHVSLSADCANRRIRLGETTGYPQRNLLGERLLLREGETVWRAAERGTALESAWRALCEPNFKGPFQGGAVRVAKAEETAAPAPAAVSPNPAPTSPSSSGPVSPSPSPMPGPRSATPAPRPVGTHVVQIGASSSETEAQAMLATVRDRAAGRDLRIETAVVAGRTWRRAVVAGFGDATEATAFCNALKSGGGVCFVRPGR